MNDLSSRYAYALFSLKKEKDSLVESQKEIKELIKILKENPEYSCLLASSSIEKELRMQLVEKAFVGVDKDIINLVKIIIENGRGKYIIDVFQDFSTLVNEYRNIKEGLLYSSEPLSEEQINTITSSISSAEGCPVELKNIIDPSLIGGVKVVINDHIYDGSIKHHIDEMKIALLK